MIEDVVYLIPEEEERIIAIPDRESKLIEAAFFNIEEIYFGNKIQGIYRTIVNSFKNEFYEA